jgi:mono/diheme cytochrome c family protein
MRNNWLTKKFVPLLRFVAIPAICMASLVFAQEQLVPDNPLKGRFVFEQKGCINCHSIKGQGGDVGPDLGDEKFYGSFLELTGIMLNHAPEMLRRMRELDLPYPEFSRAEMAELIAYLYYLRYLGEPGNLYRGKVLVQEKECLSCHSIRNKGGNSGPAFDKLSIYISPLYMAQALWNHGPEMEKELYKKGLKRPKFESGEIVDLSAYIREASRGTQREQVYMSPGNPQQGKTVFIDKNCVRCHTLNGEDDGIGTDLTEIDLDLSVTEIAGLMWNHGAEMEELMIEQNIAWPKFNGKEMADLIAYLYFLKFEDKPGDQIRGRTVFIEKGCAKCHGNEGKGSDVAPDISQSKAVSSSIDMAQIMWNHTPVMEEKITEKIMNWPEFSGKEMIDLLAFFRSIMIMSEETNK